MWPSPACTSVSTAGSSVHPSLQSQPHRLSMSLPYSINNELRSSPSPAILKSNEGDGSATFEEVFSDLEVDKLVRLRLSPTKKG